MIEAVYEPWEGYSVRSGGRVRLCETIEEAAAALIGRVDDVEAALAEARQEWAES